MERPSGAKIASVEVNVPYKRAGNVIYQQPVQFDIFQDDSQYKAVPLLSEDERRRANLPETLVFFFEQGRLKSPRKIDGNFHVIEDLVATLQQQHVLDKANGD